MEQAHLDQTDGRTDGRSEARNAGRHPLYSRVRKTPRRAAPALPHSHHSKHASEEARQLAAVDKGPDRVRFANPPSPRCVGCSARARAPPRETVRKMERCQKYDGDAGERKETVERREKRSPALTWCHSSQRRGRQHRRTGAHLVAHPDGGAAARAVQPRPPQEEHRAARGARARV